MLHIVFLPFSRPSHQVGPSELSPCFDIFSLTTLFSLYPVSPPFPPPPPLRSILSFSPFLVRGAFSPLLSFLHFPSVPLHSRLRPLSLISPSRRLVRALLPSASSPTLRSIELLGLCAVRPADPPPLLLFPLFALSAYFTISGPSRLWPFSPVLSTSGFSPYCAAHACSAPWSFLQPFPVPSVPSLPPDTARDMSSGLAGLHCALPHFPLLSVDLSHTRGTTRSVLQPSFPDLRQLASRALESHFFSSRSVTRHVLPPLLRPLRPAAAAAARRAARPLRRDPATSPATRP